VDEPVYVGKPAFWNSTTVWALLVLAIWTLMAGLTATEEPLFLGVYLLFVLLMIPAYYAVLPRRFEIHTDALEILFELTRWRVPMASITGISRATAFQVFLFRGMRAGGWPAKSCVIETRVAKPWYFMLFAPSPDLLISAKNHDAFIAALEDARAKYAASKGSMA
jgi:hypothetical protein